MVLVLSVLSGCQFNTPVKPPRHSVSYVIGGIATKVEVDDKALLQAPVVPRKGGSAYFVGWFVADQGHMWDFAHETIEADLVLEARFVELTPSNVIVDAYLDDARRTPLTFKTLQELKAANIPDGATVNLTPGVYWTDDYQDPHDPNTPDHPGLIGISFPQAGLTFKGLTANADDVRIAGNRGQTLGSQGNWNVIGVGTHFPIPSSGNSTRVSMIEYVNGERRIFPGCYIESSVYMPGAHLDFRLVGNVLSADVTTESAQTSAQQRYQLPNEIHFSVTLPSAPSTQGGFGFQFTGTASAGNGTVLESVKVVLDPR